MFILLDRLVDLSQTTSKNLIIIKSRLNTLLIIQLITLSALLITGAAISLSHQEADDICPW